MPNYHKHWYGTLAQYNALASKDSNTLYHCSEGLIYRGSVLLATRRWGDLSGKPSTFAPSAHTHTKSQITDFPTTWAWASLTGVPSTFTPSAHTHDDRYYTETEVNTLLTNKSNWDTAHGWGNHASAGYLTAITKSQVEAVLTGGITSHTHTFASLTSKPTTLSGYGVTDAYTKAGTNEEIAKAKSTNHGYRYSYDLWIYGDHDKYYPFVLAGGDQNVKRDILIKRSYNEKHPPEWNSPTHGGGLTLKLKTNFGGWGGANYGWEIHELEEMYNPTFGGCYHTTSSMTFSIMLRGGGTGGAIYHIYSDMPIENTHALHLDGDGNTSSNFPQVFYNKEVLQYLATTSKWAMSTPLTTPNTEDIRRRKFIKLVQDIDTLVGKTTGTSSLNITGNAATATILQTARTINGVSFNGSANITIKAATPYTLTRGSYLTGSNFNGSANTTWAVDATSANTAGKVVARDSNGDFACRVVNAASGTYSLKVVTGGYNYASQTYGVGIGTDGSNSGVIFYNGTGATGRIFREADVMRFTRGGLTYSGFDINANGSITVQGDMTTRTSLVVGSTNGTYVQIGSARLVYDQTNNAIKVVNANNSSCNLYATGSISAFGIGSSGGSGSSYSRLDDWADYVDGQTTDYVLSAELGYDLHTRVNSLNSFKSGTSWGGSGTGYNYLSIGGTSKVLSLYGHSHSFASLTNKPTTLGGYGITNAMPLTGGTLTGLLKLTGGLQSTNNKISLHNTTYSFAGQSDGSLEVHSNRITSKSSDIGLPGLIVDTYTAEAQTYGADMLFDVQKTTGGAFSDLSKPAFVFSTNWSTHLLKISRGGDVVVGGSIGTSTADGTNVRIGLTRILYDSSIGGVHFMKSAGGYSPIRAGSVFANNIELTSSRSMKKDIMPFKNGLDLIKSINVVSYLYKQDSDDDDRKIGFIADDTDSWLSGKSKTKYNIGNTVGALIKAVQELERKNQELEQRLLSITNNN